MPNSLKKVQFATFGKAPLWCPRRFHGVESQLQHLYFQRKEGTQDCHGLESGALKLLSGKGSAYKLYYQVPTPDSWQDNELLEHLTPVECWGVGNVRAL